MHIYVPCGETSAGMRVTIPHIDPGHDPWSFDAPNVTWKEDEKGNLHVTATNDEGRFIGGGVITQGSWSPPVTETP